MTLKKTFDYTITGLLGFTIVMMAYLFSGLLKPFTGDVEFISAFGKDTFTSILVSISSIAITLLILMVVGTLLAYRMHKKKGRWYKLAHGLIMMPMLLPPTVAGLVLLQGYGSNSLISRFMFEGDLHVAFQFGGIVLTQVFITLPYYYQMTVNGFNQIDDAYIEAAKVAGADSFVLLKEIMMPMCKNSIMAGAFISGLRGLSEFGATIMFAGNMVGKTQTMTTRIYQLYQMDVESAFLLAGFQLLVFIIPFNLFIQKHQEQI